MNFTEKHPIPATLLAAFERSDSLSMATGYMGQTPGSLGDVNLSDILTRLIQDTGRFAERYASDLFISWESVLECLRSRPVEQDEHYLFGFGIRESGVDGNTFLMSRLSNSNLPYVNTTEYRRILALRVDIAANDGRERPYITCDLRNITHALNKIHPDDLEKGAF